MKFLTAEDILGADDMPWEVVEVPEWGGSVRVRTLTGAERDRFERSIADAKGKVTFDNARAKLVAAAATGEDGRRLFSDQQAEALGKKSARALDRLYVVAARLAGLSGKDMDDLLGKADGSSPPTP